MVNGKRTRRISDYIYARATQLYRERAVPRVSVSCRRATCTCVNYTHVRIVLHNVRARIRTRTKYYTRTSNTRVLSLLVRVAHTYMC